MKRLLSLSLLLLGVTFFIGKPTAALAGVCTCSDGHTDQTAQDGCCLSCANYAKDQNKEIDRASKWREDVSGGTDTNLSCGEIHFCWCADRTSPERCFVAGSNNSVATTASCETTCAQPTANYNTIMRWFDSNYVDRRGTDSTNICGEYCWCNKPTADTGEVTTCELHRVSNKNVQGSSRRVPLRGDAECRATCAALTSPGGTRRGTYGILETTYTNRNGRANCTQGSTGANGTPAGGTTAQTPSTPPPTIRLFNPMAGASTVVDIVNRFIKILMGLVGAGALLMFIYGGIKWMTAGGDAKNVSEAQTILKNSTLGLLLLIFAYSIVSTFFSVLT